MDKKETRRGNGEGSISKRKDGRWQGRLRYIDPAIDAHKRVTVYGKSPKEVREKLKAVAKDLDQGIQIDRQKMTFGEWLTYWLENYVMR